MTTKDAFRELLTSGYKTLPMEKRRMWKMRFTKDTLSESFMEKNLLQYGYLIKSDRVWVKKS